jgi:hypothetical protein
MAESTPSASPELPAAATPAPPATATRNADAAMNFVLRFTAASMAGPGLNAG